VLCVCSVVAARVVQHADERGREGGGELEVSEGGGGGSGGVVMG
jgi:hypothetical protein